MATKKAKRTPKTKSKKLTYIGIVIDRSGSMSSVQKQAWSGLNEQIRTIRANASKGGETRVTLVQFDEQFEVLRDNMLAGELPEVDESEYIPRGSTALHDAVGRTIGLLEKQPTTADTGYLVIVISDGAENASKEWNAQSLKTKITELELSDKWTFTYMLANCDVYAVQTALGAVWGNMATYDSSQAGTSAAFTVSNASLGDYMSARSVGATHTSNFYGNTPVVSSTAVAASTTVPVTATTPVVPQTIWTPQQQKDLQTVKDALNKVMGA